MSHSCSVAVLYNTQMKQCNTTYTMRTIHTRERLMILSLAQTNKNVWTFYPEKKFQRIVQSEIVFLKVF